MKKLHYLYRAIILMFQLWTPFWCFLDRLQIKYTVPEYKWGSVDLKTAKKVAWGIWMED